MTSRNVPSSGGSLPWQNKPSKWHSNSIQLVWWSFLALYCSRASGLATTSLALSPFAAIHRLATKKVFPFNSICTMSTVSGLTIRSTEEVSAISKMSCLHHGMLQTVSTLVSNWCFRVKRISSSGGIKIERVRWWLPVDAHMKLKMTWVSHRSVPWNGSVSPCASRDSCFCSIKPGAGGIGPCLIDSHSITWKFKGSKSVRRFNMAGWLNIWSWRPSGKTPKSSTGITKG